MEVGGQRQAPAT